MLAALVPLLDSRELHLPQRAQRIQAAPGFQLLATVTCSPGERSLLLSQHNVSNAHPLGKRCHKLLANQWAKLIVDARQIGISLGEMLAGGGAAGAYGDSHGVRNMLGGLWTTVFVESATISEQAHILSSSFPQSEGLAAWGLAVLHLCQTAGGHDGMVHDPGGLPPNMAASVQRAIAASGLRPGDLALHFGRHFSLRDLFKWGRRLEARHYASSISFPAIVILHAFDCLSNVAHSFCYHFCESVLLMLQAANAVTQMFSRLAGTSSDISMLPVYVREAAFLESADCFAAMIAQPQVGHYLYKPINTQGCNIYESILPAVACHCYIKDHGAVHITMLPLTIAAAIASGALEVAAGAGKPVGPAE